MEKLVSSTFVIPTIRLGPSRRVGPCHMYIHVSESCCIVVVSFKTVTLTYTPKRLMWSVGFWAMVRRSIIVTKMFPCKLRWSVLIALNERYFRGVWDKRIMCYERERFIDMLDEQCAVRFGTASHLFFTESLIPPVVGLSCLLLLLCPWQGQCNHYYDVTNDWIDSLC